MAQRTTTPRASVDEQTLNQLEALGLNSSEAKIYTAALTKLQTKVSDLANQTGINRRNIYDGLSTLINKGLMFQIVGEREGTYAAVEPAKLMELVQSKELALETIMRSMEQRYASPSPGENAIIYKGLDGFKNYLEDILATEQNVYCLGAKGGWGFAELGDFADWFEQERIRKKIKVFNLFDWEMHDVKQQKKPLYDTYAEHRFLPKEYSTNSGVDVFGDKVVTFTGLYPEKFDENVTLFVMTNRDIAEAIKVWFHNMWDNCPQT